MEFNISERMGSLFKIYENNTKSTDKKIPTSFWLRLNSKRMLTKGSVKYLCVWGTSICKRFTAVRH